MTSLRKMTQDSLTGEGNYKSLRVLAVPVVIVGAVLTGFGATAMPAQKTFQSYGEVGSAAGLSAFSTLAACIVLLLVGGILMLMGGLGMMLAGHKNNKGGAVCSIIVLVVGSGLGLAAGILINFTVLDMTLILCEDSTCNPRDSDFSDRMVDIVTVELALFDECCVPNMLGWSTQQTNFATTLGHPDPDLFGDRVQQTAFGVCEGDVFTDNCAGVVPNVISDVLLALVPLLCTCAPDEVLYNKARQGIQDLGTCAQLTSATLTIDSSTTVPRVNARVLPLIVGQEPEYFSQFPEETTTMQVPLVGSPGAAWDKTVMPNGGFGCGLGQTKGYIWWTQMYAVENIIVPANAGVGCSVVGLLCGIIATAFLMMGRGSGDDMFNYQDDYSLNVSPAAPVVRREDGPRPNATANTAAAAAPVPEAVPATQADRKSVRDMQAKRDALEKRLNDFYAVHEPAKLTAGRVHPDVVSFALARGVPALNAKLRAKYGTDLDEDAQSESSGGGDSRNIMGEKLVKRDVDDII